MTSIAELPSPTSRLAGSFKVAVYGTLKSGCSNSWLWDVIAQESLYEENPWRHVKCTIWGISLRETGFGFPAALREPNPTKAVIGELWWTDDATLSTAALKALDRLEGVAMGLYRRIPYVVRPFGYDGAVSENCWLYVAGREMSERVSDNPPVYEWSDRIEQLTLPPYSN